MTILASAVALLAIVQLIAEAPSSRRGLERHLGGAFLPVRVLATAGTVALIILGWRAAPAVPVYDPPFPARVLAFILVALAAVMAGIALFRGKLRLKLRFPLVLALGFLSAGHLLADGKLASIVLFGGLLGLAVLLVIFGLAAGRRPVAEARSGHDLLSLLSGLALFAAMAQLHPVFTGVPVLTLSR
jgi:uncharacterized membrane protein